MLGPDTGPVRVSEKIAAARTAYADRAWQRAFDAYAAAEQDRDLGLADLERFATSAHLLGRFPDYFKIRERAYHRQLAEHDGTGAALTAAWIGVQRMTTGDYGAGTGWLGRASRLVEEHGACLASIPLDVAAAYEAEASGELDQALTLMGDAVARARRFGDSDWFALALCQQGALLLRLGRTVEGLARLDEAMVGVCAGETSPMVTGIVYCGVVRDCWSVYELGRAMQWTAAMSVWCDSQPELANFTAECKVHRAGLKQFHGRWEEALGELARVSHADVHVESAAMAAYAQGDIDRLCGRFESAEAAFKTAAELGLEPQPGLALLRLARGSTQAAAAMVRRALAEIHEPGRRVELLVAATEVFLAVDDTTAATQAAAQLAAIESRQASPVLTALAGQTQASVDVASGRSAQALEALRSALRVWRQVDAPYAEARTRVLLAQACRALGDTESADRELATARNLFEQLGAAPDLAAARRRSSTDRLLTPREVEVLRLVARGASNKVIARELVLSERTVDRHVSNIFVKLGVASRAAATAYALGQDLV